MTDRLYYNDAYLTEFGATVLEIRDGKARLDRSAFYPTSGGQPFDTGTLGDARVTDVYVDDEGEVWHAFEGDLTQGEKVCGKIDWPRRFDHMQQHAGEHMIAGEIYHQLNGTTIGLHLGQDFSTIDVTLPDGTTRISDEEVARIEDAVNASIQNDVPIRCWFPDEEELRSLPLRKAPTVKEHVRVVRIGETEMVACGGTHPSTAGQIGLVKILSVAPSRGKMRVSFVCGRRAFEHCRRVSDAADRAALLFSTGWDNLENAAARSLERLREAEHELREAQTRYALLLCDGLLAKADAAADGNKAVAAVLEGLSLPVMRDMAEKITSKGAYALLACPQEDRMNILFARPEGAQAKMGRLLGECCRRHGGKGGGKDDLAQGSAPDAAPVYDALGILCAETE